MRLLKILALLALSLPAYAQFTQLPSGSGVIAKTCTGNDKFSAVDANGDFTCSTDVSAGSPSFDGIASGTNTSAAMVVGTGASLAVSGSGTIAATTADALTNNPAALTAGAYCSDLNADGTCASETDATTEINSLIATHAGDASAHHTATVARTDAEIEDLAGGTVSGNTESGITVVYQVADNTIDFTVNTAPALAANGANCSAGSYPLGVDDAGAVESCTDASTETDSLIATHAGDSAAHHAAALPLAGGTMTAEFVADALGIEFEPGDALTDCSTFSATGGGIFFDDSEGVLKKCEDNVLSVLDTTGGTPATADISDVSVTQTELAELETIGATTISANQWATLGGIAETLGSAELDLLDGITVLSGSNTGDDDVPESGDFGNAADLESTGALSIDVVAAAEMADADHGDVSWTGGVATVESGTLTSELFADATGIEFEPGDALTDCSTFAATGGGIFYDDSEGVLKKCQDNVLSVLDTTGGTPATADISDVSVTQTELAELETIGATTISANQWATLGGIAETLGSAELNLLDGITVLSGSNTGDDDVPESGDFGNAADLESTGALSIDVVAAAEMADADHGDVSWTGGVATVESGTLTSELFADALGIEFEPGDALTDCSTFAATGGGIFYDDSEGVLKKCQDNVLSVLDTTGGTPATADISDVSVTQTELAELETIGATTISANQWATLGGIAETLGSAELNLLDGITVLSGSNTGDDDVPESGDFGAAADLETTGALSIDVVAAAEMADADHGDVSWTGGVAAVQSTAANAVDSDSYVDGSVDPVHLADHTKSIWFPVAALSADGTQCADPAEVTVGSWGKQFAVICTDNNAATLTGSVQMPDGWNAGTVTFELSYIQDAADTSALNSDVAARCVGATETPAAYGTEVAIDDAAVTGSDAIDNTTSGAVTAAGTCVAGDYLQFQWQLDATGTTTAVATLNILGFKMEYTVADDDN